MDWAEAHNPRFDSGNGGPHDAHERLPPVRIDGRVRRNEHGSGPVVDARGVARRHGSVLRERGAQLAQRLQRSVGPGWLVRFDDDWVAFSLGDLYYNDLVLEPPF